jgi:endonuclease/exonuclease/phosphatase family metal-dependent hydrolase
VEIDGAGILVGALHNDSSDMDNNFIQMRQILDHIGDRPSLLGGDFNAAPDTPPMLLLRRSGQFSGAFDGENTYPAERPVRRLDYVLAPRSWELLTHDVLTDTVSSHLPVVSTFRLPP